MAKAVVALVAALGIAATGGCARDGGAQSSGAAGQQEYLPGLPVAVDRPDAEPDAVVVLVPGGGWSSANPDGLAPLAQSLTEAGLAVVTITYGTSGTGDHYPRPVDDVACAGAYAADQVPDVPVVLVGHSAGAHLVALAGLVPERDDASCPWPAHAADAVVGLAGPYDVTQAGRLPENLFDVAWADDPDLWAEGDPMTWAGERAEVPFLLVHGQNDVTVPTSFTTDLADALTAGGHGVTVDLLPGVTHDTVYRPEVLTGLLVDWVRGTVVGQG